MQISSAICLNVKIITNGETSGEKTCGMTAKLRLSSDNFSQAMKTSLWWLDVLCVYR